MTKKIIIALSCLATIAGLWSCVKNPVDGGPVKSAIKLVTSDLGTTWVTLALEPYGEPINSYVVADPVPVSVLPSYASMDAVQKLDYLNEKGKAYSSYLESFDKFTPGETYVIGYMGKKADGTICSSPTFSSFTMGTSRTECSIKADTTDIEKKYYECTIKKNSLTAYYKYIFSLEEKFTMSSSDELRRMIVQDGEGKTAINDTTIVIEAPTSAACIIAVVAYDKNDLPGEFSFADVDGPEKKIAEDVPVSPGKTATIRISTRKARLTINVGNREYGFMPYSGNGGVGTVENEFSAVPYYNMMLDSTLTYKFYVEKSVGRMMPIDEGGEPFWVNAGRCQVDFTCDLTNTTDNIPRYRMQIVNEDSRRVFYEGFDLFVTGGFYLAPVDGSAYVKGGGVPLADVPKIEGTEAGIKGDCTTTTNGIVPFTCGGPTVESKDAKPSEAYIKNRDMTGWQLKRISEFPGFIQLGNKQSTHFDAYFVTPMFTTLTGPTNVTIKTACYRFGPAGKADIHMSILGSGTMTKAEWSNTAGESGTETVSKNEFIMTEAMCPAPAANADKNKVLTTVTLTVAGASSDTQFKMAIDQEATGEAGRCQIDYVSVTK